MNLVYLLFGVGIGFILFGTRRKRPADKRRPAAIFAGVLIEDFEVIGEIEMLELKEGQKADLTVGLKTAHGHAAGIEPGSARFVSTDESIVSVEQDPDNELKATVRGLDGSSNGSATIEFRADGKQGDGVREIVGVITVVCTQGDATVVELTAGDAVDDDQAAKPQPAPQGKDAAADVAADNSDGSELSSTTDAADTPAGTVDGGSTLGEDNVSIGTADDGKVHAGDPGTATGPPIEQDNPNAGTTHPTPPGVEAGQPADPNVANMDPKNVDPADRINAGGPGSAKDPAEGQPTLDGSKSDVDGGGMTFAEAAAKAKEADDNASPSNDVTGPGSPSGSF